MLTKSEIIHILKTQSLPVNEYWVTSGAGMVLHGVKEFTRDIDLGCTTALVEHLITKGYEHKLLADGTRTLNIGKYIELFENWTVEEILKMDDIPVATLYSIKIQKLELNRDKDLKDIELINAYLN